MEDADGMEWAWKPNCLELAYESSESKIDRLVNDVLSLIKSREAEGETDLEIKVLPNGCVPLISRLVRSSINGVSRKKIASNVATTGLCLVLHVWVISGKTNA